MRKVSLRRRTGHGEPGALQAGVKAEDEAGPAVHGREEGRRLGLPGGGGSPRLREGNQVAQINYDHLRNWALFRLHPAVTIKPSWFLGRPATRRKGWPSGRRDGKPHA